jgi:hypothetical protein
MSICFSQSADPNEMRQHLFSDVPSPPATQSIQNNSAIGSGNEAAMVSGFGQYHTNEIDTDKPSKKLTAYDTITWSEIVSMALTPPSVSKEKGQWFIPSTLASRSFKVQETDGEYWVLCFDFDLNTLPLNEVVESVDEAIGSQVQLVAYTSRSATPKRSKCRVLLPVASALSYRDYQAVLSILNDRLEASRKSREIEIVNQSSCEVKVVIGHDLMPDRALEGAAQLVYLPNRGDFYDYRTCNGALFDPLKTMTNELAQYFDAIDIKRQTAQIEREARRVKAIEKRQAITTSKYARPIDAFNDSYTVEEILSKADYDFDGLSNYRHPRSESGSYSASILKGRVYSLSPNDPLYTADASNGAHDAFSAFCTLFHGGDQNAAIKNAGNNMLLINGEPWNKVAQREHIQNKTISNASSLPLLDKIGQAHGVIQEAQSEPFSLAQFSLNGTSKQMREKMLADKFVLGRLAILGQITLFSAPPNAGKTLLTLWLLRQAIEAGDIAASDVFYINADDNHRGLVEKLSFAEGLGFHTLAPSHNKFDPNKFLDYVKKMVVDNNARGKVIILDTIKKFLDVMDKKKSSDGSAVFREFVSHGGSVIMLGHVNKHLGGDGKHIVGGTSDLRDDADCAYILTPTKHAASGETTVLFENTKSRGDVAETASYCYTRTNGQGYNGLLATVRLATDEETSYARKATAMEILLTKNHEVIHAILDSMKSGLKLKTEIIKDAADRAVVSKGIIKKVLSQHTGDNLIAGHRWKLTIEANNAHVYRPHPLLVPKEPPTTSQSYSEASNGE